MAGGAVVPDRCGHGEEAMGDAGGDAVDGAAAVEFVVELAFQGLVDRFDELADGFEQVLGGVWGAVAIGRAQQPHPSCSSQVGVER